MSRIFNLKLCNRKPAEYFLYFSLANSEDKRKTVDAYLSLHINHEI